MEKESFVDRIEKKIEVEDVTKEEILRYKGVPQEILSEIEKVASGEKDGVKITLKEVSKKDVFSMYFRLMHICKQKGLRVIKKKNSIIVTKVEQ